MNTHRKFSMVGALCCASLALACRPQSESTSPAQSTPDGSGDETSSVVVWPDEPFRAKQPPAREMAPVKIPEVEQFTLANGLEVYLVREDKLPVFSMSLQFDVGGAGDPIKEIGQTSLCMDLIDEGTASMDKPAFEAKQDELAISVWVSGGSETSTANARGLTTQFDAGMALLSEMLQKPGLRKDDFERLSSQRKASIEQRRASAGGAARRVFDEKIWGAEHPFGAVETEATIDAVSLGDCKKVAKRLRPAGARLFVFGKLDKATIERAFDQHFAAWKGTQRADKAVSPAKPDTGAIYVVDVPDSAQSQIMVGYPGPQRTAPDYTATTLMARVLGGGFTSRLNMNLREDKGFAYGARGGFRYTRDASTFSASSSVETSTTAAALVEIEKEMAGMLATPPTEDELAREKDGALLTMPARYATASDALARFRSLVYYGLALDYDETFQTQVRALGLPEVKAAAGKYMRTKGVTVVVAGDKASVGPQLEALVGQGQGPFGAKRVVYLDADAKPE